MTDFESDFNTICERFGGLWPKDKVALKMTEELGEVVRADRKLKRADVLDELGDLFFAFLAFCKHYEVTIESVWTRFKNSHQ